MKRALIVTALILLLAPAARSAPTAQRTLGNGMEVAVFRDDRLPVVQIHLLTAAGSRDESPLEAGAARLTAMLVARGTSSRNAAEFASEVERLGGTLSGDATLDYATLSGAFRAEDLEPALELVADAAINPIFEDAELVRARGQMFATVVESRRHLALLADAHLWARALAGHPYARPEIGTPEQLGGLTRARVVEFHRAHYRPDRARLAIAGDVDPERALELAAEYFGGWGGKVKATATTPLPARPEGLGIRLVDVPGATEAEIRLGLRMPPRSDPDVLPLVVANDLLGGGAGSRLARGQGRVRRMYSTLTLYQDAGLLVLGAAARNDSVLSVLETLRGELARFTADPPAAAQIEASRRSLGRAFPIQNEAVGNQALQWLVGRHLDISPDFPDRHAERLAAVTPEAVRAAAARWFDAARGEIVVAGAALALRPGLERLGTVDVVSFEEAPVPEAIAPAMRTDEPDAAALERGKALAQRLVAAHGGIARLKGIKDSRVEYDLIVYSGDQRVNGRQVELRREPGRVRIENTFPDLATVQALSGETGWSRVHAGGRDSLMVEDKEGVDVLKHLFSSDLPHLLVAAVDPQSRTSHRGQDDLGGGTADVLEVVDPSGARRVLFVHPTTHRLLAVEENVGSALRGPSMRRTLGETKTVQGIVWPHLEERFVNGIRTMTLTARSVQINTGINEQAFQKPSKDSPRRPRR